MHSLYRLLSVFEWTKECQKLYDALKKALASTPILRAPNWNLVFHVHIDASNFVIGCMLAQLGKQKLDHPIYFVSKQLNEADKNYTTEREGLSMVYAVKKFRR